MRVACYWIIELRCEQKLHVRVALRLSTEIAENQHRIQNNHNPKTRAEEMFSNAEFKYTPEQREKLKELRKLVEDSDDLEIGTEEVLLSKFLNYTGWVAEKAFNAILRYYEFKSKHPDWVARHSVEHYRGHFHDTLSKFVMPKPDREGRAIVIFNAVDAFNRYPDYWQDLIEMDDLIFESLFLIPNVQKYGITVIFDLDGITRNFLRLFSPSMARIMNAKNEILPVTRRVVHIIQKGLLMNIASTLIVPFMNEELQKNIFIHNGKNFDKLRDMIGYDNLPAAYGGPEENICDVNLIYSHMLKNADYLSKIQDYRKKS